MDDQQALADRIGDDVRRIALIGAIGSGKTTLARTLIKRSVSRGRVCALLDADLGQKAVGPPTTLGLRIVREEADLEPERLEEADSLYFVGSLAPEESLLPVVTGTGRLVDKGFELGADLVVVDTGSLVSGWEGQYLKFHKLELIQPDLLVSLQRGEELAPLLGIVQRFFSCEVVQMRVHPEVTIPTVEQRAAHREDAMRRYFSQPLHRWRIKPTVFMPVLPPLFDLSQLSRIVVGLSDGGGAYLGLGYLESGEDGALRLVSPVADAPKALRLGAVRLEESFAIRRADLRGLLGTD
jgi:polynucleotide 5'-hydroxyl-kinase GRC3/NOL9